MRYLFLLTLFLSANVCFSQDYKFGKVSKDELSLLKDSTDPSANATVLYKNEAIFFKYVDGKGFRQTRQVHERIKIYNKEGFDWATKRIKLYNKSNSQSENLHGLKGSTYNLVNGKIEEDKLKDDGQFKEEVNKYWKIESFTMPNIQEGCVLEYKYDIDSPYLTIADVELQYTIPISEYNLTIKTPEYFIYNRLLNPKAGYIPKLDDSKSHNSINFSFRESDMDGDRVRGLGSSTSRKIHYQKIDYQENVIEVNETNIPALIEEPFVDNLDNYRSKLIMEITATKLPNQIMEYLSSSWEDVARTIYKDSDFGNQIDRNNYYKYELLTLIQGETDELKKTFLIFNFVKSKVRWNGFYGFSSDMGVRKAYEEGSGNAADINLMLTSMLRFAGLEANPVLVSTKSNGIPIFPTVQGFNYVVCIIQGTDFTGILDATDPLSSINLLPERALNWQGRLIKEDGSSYWVNMMSQISADETTYLNATLENNIVKGKVRSVLNNHEALNFRNEYGNISPERFSQILEKKQGHINISGLSIENIKNLSQPISVNYEYESMDSAEIVGDKIIFYPLLFLKENENLFQQENRNYPIDFKYPSSKKYIINIRLPDGYKIASLPEGGMYKFQKGLADYSFLIQSTLNSIQVKIDFDIKTSFITTTDYPFYRQFYNSIFTKQSEQVVLEKI